MNSTRRLLESSLQAQRSQPTHADGEARSTGSEALFVHLYDHLRRLGQHYLSEERPGHTLQATALVHEIYVKLLGNSDREWESRSHFLAVAALAMRQLLQNHARDRNAQKRGGGWQRVTLGLAAEAAEQQDVDLITLSDALDELQRLNQRHAQVATARLIGGLTVEETATALGFSPRTVKNDWRIARAWLSRQLTPSE